MSKRKSRSTAYDTQLAYEDDYRRFIIASANRQHALVQHYLDSGIHPDGAPAGKPSALCYAVLGSDLDLAWTLIKAGADINFQDGQGNTPAIYAVMAASVDCLALLIRWGANLSLTNNQDKRAVDYSDKPGDAVPELKRLLDQGERVNVGIQDAVTFH